MQKQEDRLASQTSHNRPQSVSYFFQTHVHKAVMEELKRIIEDSEVTHLFMLHTLTRRQVAAPINILLKISSNLISCEKSNLSVMALHTKPHIIY